MDIKKTVDKRKRMQPHDGGTSHTDSQRRTTRTLFNCHLNCKWIKLFALAWKSGLV